MGHKMKFKIGDKVRYINEKQVNTIIQYSLTDQTCSYQTEDRFGQRVHNIAEMNLVAVEDE